MARTKGIAMIKDGSNQFEVLKKDVINLLVVAMICFSCFSINSTGFAALLRHNAIKDIENCKGKLHLNLVRVWGGDEETDENKFFETPHDVAVDSNQRVYICDKHNHCIKVFDFSGKYLQTIGIKGRGPGDLYSPDFIDFFYDGNLLVYEDGGRRFQWFNSQGKSIDILKYNGYARWFGVTSKDEIVVYDWFKTFRERKLVSIIDKKGKVLKEFGRYLDNARNRVNSEGLVFAMDETDNVYAANMSTPIIRKYAANGQLQMVITFATPFEIPVEITLNASGDEIEIKGETGNDENVTTVGKGEGVAIQVNSGKGRKKYGICIAIAIDSKNRIYVVSRRRSITKKEEAGMGIIGGAERLNRKFLNFDIVGNIDVNQLLVFDSEGKIIAQAPMTTFCGKMIIYSNRLFIVDGMYNQRILEYEMSFKN